MSIACGCPRESVKWYVCLYATVISKFRIALEFKENEWNNNVVGSYMHAIASLAFLIRPDKWIPLQTFINVGTQFQLLGMWWSSTQKHSPIPRLKSDPFGVGVDQSNNYYMDLSLCIGAQSMHMDPWCRIFACILCIVGWFELVKLWDFSHE